MDADVKAGLEAAVRTNKPRPVVFVKHDTVNLAAPVSFQDSALGLYLRLIVVVRRSREPNFVRAAQLRSWGVQMVEG